jgi:tetratricopeptide (TPR) repeat protein
MSKQSNQEASTFTERTPQDHHFTLLMLGVFLLLLIMQFGGAAGLLTDWWGIDQARHLPALGQVLIGIVGLVVIVPYTRNLAGGWIASDRRLIPVKKARWLQAAVVLTGVGLFWAARSATHFLGDGYIRAREINDPHLFSIEQPLDKYIHRIVWDWTRYLDWSGIVVYTAISICAGGLYLLTSYYTKNNLARKPGARRFAWLMVVSVGAMQMFFGYVENYSLLVLMTLIYLTVLFSKSPHKIYWLAGILSLTACIHISGLFMAPSFLWFAWRHYNESHKEKFWKLTLKLAGAISLPLLFLLALILWEQFPLDAFFSRNDKTGSWLPLSMAGLEHRVSYTLFSLHNLKDVANELLLVAPMVAFLAVAVLWRRKGIWSGDAATDSTLIMCFSFLVFLFAFDLKKGASRDWDIFAVIALPITIWGVRYLLREFPGKLRSIALVVVCYSLLQTSGFIAINADADLSLQRLDALVQEGAWSDIARGDAYDELRVYYEKTRNDKEAAMKYGLLARETLNNPRYYMNVGVMYYAMGRLDESVDAYMLLMEKFPEYPAGNRNIASILSEAGRNQEALPFALKASNFFPNDAVVQFNTGVTLYYLKDIPNAIKFFQHAIKLKPDFTAAHQNLQIAQSMLQQ